MSNFQALLKPLDSIVIIIIFALLGGLTSCQNDQTYQDSDLGISLTIPKSWDVTKSSRAQILELTPNRKDEAPYPVSITIFSVKDNGDILLTLENEVRRLQQTLHPSEVTIVNSVGRLLNEENVKAHFELLVTHGLLQEIVEQPIELILLQGRQSSLIVVQIHRSIEEENFNSEIDDIINTLIE